MTARTEQKLPGFGAKRSPLGVDGDRVGGAFLGRVAHLETDPVCRLDRPANALEMLDERWLMFAGYREMELQRAFGGGGERKRLDEVLLEGRTCAIPVPVERDQTLRPLRESETVGLEQAVENEADSSGIERVGQRAAARAECVVEVVGECESARVIEEPESGFGVVVRCIRERIARSGGARPNGEERFEHPGRGAGRRNEVGRATGGGSALVGVKEGLFLLGSDPIDSVVEVAGSIQSDCGRGRTQDRELAAEFVLGETVRGGSGEILGGQVGLDGHPG